MRFIFQILVFSSLVLAVACKPEPSASKVTSTGEAALDKLNAIVAKNPDDHSILFERAKYQYDQKDYDGTINDLKAAIGLDSLVPEYYHLLSDAYIDYYRSREGLNTMVTAAEKFPERIPTLLKLAETQLILKLNDESLLTVAQILTIDPDNAEGHFMTGMNFRAMGETDRAINAFMKATESDPDLVDAWVLIGDLFEQKGEPVALRYYTTATEVAPDDPTTWHAKAYFLQNNGDDAGALEIYRKINIIDKNYTDAYLNAGILYMSSDSLDKSKEQFDIMAKIQPQNHLPYYYRGLIYEAEGNISAARKELQNCLNLSPDFEGAKKAMMGLSNS